MTNILLGIIVILCIGITYSCVSVYLILKKLVGNPWMVSTISQENRYI